MHLIDDVRVVLRECDAVSYRFSSLLLVQTGDLAPALELGLLASAGACVRQARGARLGGRGGALAEQPRFRRLQLLDVVAVVGKEGARRLDVADARELQREPYALLVALATELVHLGAQLLGGIGGLGRLRDLALEFGDLGVALLECGLVVAAGLGGGVIARCPLLAPASPRRARRPARPVAASRPRHSASSRPARHSWPVLSVKAGK